MNARWALIFTLIGFACRGPAPRPQGAEPSAAAIPPHYRDIAYPAFAYQPPDPRDYRVEIADSAVAYLVADRRLPWIQVRVFLRETTLPRSPAEVAATALLGPMYRRGGARDIPAAQLDDTLEYLAAGIGGDLGAHYAELSLQCLSRDFPVVLDLLRRVYFAPAFDSTRLELQKAVYAQNLRHRFDKPADVVRQLHQYALYQSNPRVWTARVPEVEQVRRADLERLAQGRFGRGKIVFAVSGDFDRDSMITALQEWVAQWPVRSAEPQKPVALEWKNRPGIYIADKQATQASVRMEQPFVRRPHPDYYPTVVASYILGGGGFTSRLTTRVRSDEGLAYSVYSFAGSDYDDTAGTGVVLQTKVETAAYALKIVFDEIRKLAEQGPTPQELESAKQSLIESLPGLFDSPHATAELFARSEIWGRSLDHFKNYPDEIRRVTADDVRRCIRQYFALERMTVSIAGPARSLLAGDTARGISLRDLGLGEPRLVPLDSLELR